MTSQWRHRNKTHSWYSELNSLQNVYFGFFIFGKLIEWRCFVTYLWNDPRIWTVNMVIMLNFFVRESRVFLLLFTTAFIYSQFYLTLLTFFLRCDIEVLLIFCSSSVLLIWHYLAQIPVSVWRFHLWMNLTWFIIAMGSTFAKQKQRTVA